VQYFELFISFVYSENLKENKESLDLVIGLLGCFLLVFLVLLGNLIFFYFNFQKKINEGSLEI
jgi:hypothetical protein